MHRYSKHLGHIGTVRKLSRVQASLGTRIAPEVQRHGHRHKVADRFPAGQLSQIAQEYVDGATSTGLCRTYQLSKSAVLKILKDAGVDMRMRPLTGEQIQAGRALYESGLSLSRAASQMGVPQDTLRRALLAAGVPLRPSGGSAAGRVRNSGR